MRCSNHHVAGPDFVKSGLNLFRLLVLGLALSGHPEIDMFRFCGVSTSDRTIVGRHLSNLKQTHCEPRSLTSAILPGFSSLYFIVSRTFHAYQYMTLRYVVLTGYCWSFFSLVLVWPQLRAFRMRPVCNQCLIRRSKMLLHAHSNSWFQRLDRVRPHNGQLCLRPRMWKYMQCAVLDI